MMKQKHKETLSRVFFVTDSVEDNEELFETLEGAMAHISMLKKKDKPKLKVMIVRNAYKDDNGEWTYDDLSDTFELIRTLKKE